MNIIRRSLLLFPIALCITCAQSQVPISAVFYDKEVSWTAFLNGEPIDRGTGHSVFIWFDRYPLKSGKNRLEFLREGEPEDPSWKPSPTAHGNRLSPTTEGASWVYEFSAPDDLQIDGSEFEYTRPDLDTCIEAFRKISEILAGGDTTEIARLFGVEVDELVPRWPFNRDESTVAVVDEDAIVAEEGQSIVMLFNESAPLIRFSRNEFENVHMEFTTMLFTQIGGQLHWNAGMEWIAVHDGVVE